MQGCKAQQHFYRQFAFGKPPQSISAYYLTLNIIFNTPLVISLSPSKRWQLLLPLVTRGGMRLE